MEWIALYLALGLVTGFVAGLLGASLEKHLAILKAMPLDAMVAARQAKFRNIAQFYTES